MQRFAHPTFAPEGRRSVATGGASPAAKRAKRNPWTHSHLNNPAPAGRRELHRANKMPRNIFERAPPIAYLSMQRASPSPLRGEKRMMNRFSTGSVSGRFAAAPLHPWLQPVAPPGRERVAGRATSSGQGKSLICPTWLSASGTPADTVTNPSTSALSRASSRVGGLLVRSKLRLFGDAGL